MCIREVDNILRFVLLKEWPQCKVNFRELGEWNSGSALLYELDH